MPSTPPARDPYIHGTTPEEHARLGWMNQLLNARELDQIGLEGGERVLELGAGTGLFARALAERLPRGRLLAIELDEQQLAAARASAAGLALELPRIELRQGDACAPPLAPEEWGSFDLAHARFLLEHLTRPSLSLSFFPPSPSLSSSAPPPRPPCLRGSLSPTLTSEKRVNRGGAEAAEGARRRKEGGKRRRKEEREKREEKSQV